MLGGAPAFFAHNNGYTDLSELVLCREFDKAAIDVIRVQLVLQILI